ncbi:MAG: hypothetical protein QW668_04505, partial [Nitrososphaerota archaeon]
WPTGRPMNIHEEEKFTKTYDAALMRRLLQYIRPYWTRHRLLRLSRAFNLAAVVTNQVMARPDEFFSYNAVSPVGGHIVGHTSHMRLFIRKTAGKNVRIVRLVSSPHLPEGEVLIKITENGVEDAEEAEVRSR